jgi:hypothetical protein
MSAVETEKTATETRSEKLAHGVLDDNGPVPPELKAVMRANSLALEGLTKKSLC